MWISWFGYSKCPSMLYGHISLLPPEDSCKFNPFYQTKKPNYYDNP